MLKPCHYVRIALKSYRRIAASMTKSQLDQHQQTRLTPMKSARQILLSGMLAAAVMAVAPSARAQQINGTPGSPDATATTDAVRRRDQGKRQGFHTLLAAARGAAQGRAERVAHHD